MNRSKHTKIEYPNTQIQITSTEQDQTKKETPNYIIPSIKPGPMPINDMMTLEINFQTISLVQLCEAYKTPYLIFLIPFCYLLAQTLTYYQQHSHLQIQNLLHALCKRINKIKSSSNPQIDEGEITAALVNFLNFKKLGSRKLCALLGIFLKNYLERMEGFLPVYLRIFEFHAFEKYQFVERVAQEQPSIAKRRQMMKAKINQIYLQCKQYHNEEV